VGHEDRHVAVGRVGLAGEALGQRQEGGQRHHPGQPVRVAQAGVEGDRPALGEARQHDALVGDAAGVLAGDQRLHLGRRGFGALDVLGAVAVIARVDVEPRPHHVAAVDGHRPLGRVGKDEAGGRQAVGVELVHHRLEIVAVGAQAVQPDHGVGGCGPGEDFDGGQEGFGHGGSWQQKGKWGTRGARDCSRARATPPPRQAAGREVTPLQAKFFAQDHDAGAWAE
jgi:hypothetical protein